MIKVLRKGGPMRQGTAPLLSGYRVIHTREPDEVRAFLHRLGSEFDVTAKDARQLDACINTACLPSMHIAYVHYGTNVSVWTTEANCDYWVVPPLRGYLETVAGDSCSIRRLSRQRSPQASGAVR